MRDSQSSRHIPVLLQETAELLSVKETDVVVDATVGMGGHAKELARGLGPSGVLIAIDKDANALEGAREVLGSTSFKVYLHEDSYEHLTGILSSHGIEEANVILLDLGFNSEQISQSGRGFSFERDEPLVMSYKVNPGKNDLTAERAVNTWSEEHLADVLYGYGEEKFARRIAKMIVQRRLSRPIRTTKDLVEIVKSATPRWHGYGKRHIATRTFQALRIAVNDEIETLRRGLQASLAHLASKGRMGVITFHSTEDRVVKHFFANASRGGLGSLVNKKPITSSRVEVRGNPRSRSAKLRVFEKR
jgi:16S rRNA (cytosine1402-N4)-methyltransferase